jgi:hypothetical protein
MLANQCSHNAKWGECRECKLAAARSLVDQWGSEIDAARAVIAEASRERMEELKKTEFEL